MAKLSATSVLKSASGMEIPVFGLGTWQSSDAELEKALNAALEAGYRLIDTAALYANEAVIGRVLSQWFSSGKLRRQDLFITTKLAVDANNPKYVKKCLETQLKELQLEYVDLYLIHMAVGLVHGESLAQKGGPKLDMETDILALWKEMENQVDAGLTKAIGVSNFNTKQIERILNIARIPPANLQIELHLYTQAKVEQEFCKRKGITLTSYATLGSPGAPAGALSGANFNPLQDPVVGRIAKSHNRNPGQVLLRHVLQSGIAIIPKSTNPDRIRDNIKVFDFELTPAEMTELNSLDKGEEGRRFHFDNLRAHPEYPYPK
uniref:NADP-dependent oxidoreductase domain-containing protein n=1 Tax=Graphocephala atropunctata TaxID=36148 RepID=A0A1B6M3B1_9HEMI